MALCYPANKWGLPISPKDGDYPVMSIRMSLPERCYASGNDIFVQLPR